VGHLWIIELELALIKTLEFSLCFTMHVYFLTAPLLRSLCNALLIFFLNKILLNKTKKKNPDCHKRVFVLGGFGVLVFFSLNNFPLKFLVFAVLPLKFSGESWRKTEQFFSNLNTRCYFFTRFYWKKKFRKMSSEDTRFHFYISFLYKTSWIAGPKLKSSKLLAAFNIVGSNLHRKISAKFSSIFLNLRN